MIYAKRLLLIFAASVLFFTPLYAQQNGTLIHDGQTRSYIYYLPDQISEPLPLLIAMHGYTQTANSIMNFSAFNQLADEQNFMVVYPQGIGNSWNVDFGGGSTADDVGFINALIDKLSGNFLVDKNRVYATGFSNGGFMSYRLAYELPEKIAAIAPVAGTIASQAFANWEATNAKPILHIHGTGDFIVPFDGIGGSIESVDTLLDFWIAFNGCNSTPTVTELPDLVQEGSTVTQYEWNQCDSAKPIKLLKVINGGHTWPGTSASGIGIVNQDIIASEEIWNFVKNFSLNDWVITPENNNKTISVYPNPLSGNFLFVENLPENSRSIAIYDALGKLIQKKKLNNVAGTFRLHLDEKRQGIFLIKIVTDYYSTSYKVLKY
ncbi:MAG: T9SS type A sorting domain-containing protein [Bacteroidales bacterium]|jgi:polyhydroxybutyrate depolymerase|nr:T9SS type A sorting domain-containing protein [Bacteroidales bacterium]